MDDTKIIELFVDRNERAIAESQNKYGRFLTFLAKNILTIKEDAEECVNDTYLTAWNRIPPIIPESLKAFLGRLVRDISISKYRANHAAKRYSGMDVLLSELEDCLPSSDNVDEGIERAELTGIINSWLITLPAESRALFVRRYWYGDSVKTLAIESGCSQNTMAQRMFNLRKALKEALEKEGVNV